MSPLFWRLNVAGWLGYGAATWLTYALVLADMPARQRHLYLAYKALRMGLGFGLSLVLHRVCRLLRRRRPHLGLAVAGVLGTVSVLGAVWSLLLWAASMPLFPSRVPDWSYLPREVLNFGIVLAAWSAAYFAVKAWQERQEQERQRLEARALAHEARLQALRHQLNPHFLFNALNSIRATIGEDATKAQTMVTQLSELLRAALGGPDRSLASLGEELEMVENYLALEKVRFEERLDVRVELAPEAARATLPAFTLQPLVENAVKHGLRAGHTLRIHVRAWRDGERLRVEVANTGSLQARAGASTGIGLRNVRERLESLFSGRHDFQLVEEEGQVIARLSIEEDHGGPHLRAAGG
ncbi:histidine kinase [Pyxidicoccus fallax]|uniref:Histidine kinase n=1 Tax=Pyxidicoccus fallax TaxID=394095 RepID=A0A848LGR1_9BACT|nr:histidine kinase [Pyxidicoccus fallax]NMO15278.1 histidine kinase [Pyxidicoccus fallax]NPC77609.1 histidine kinase [Pyxidicoccus fallax]